MSHSRGHRPSSCVIRRPSCVVRQQVLTYFCTLQGHFLPVLNVYNHYKRIPYYEIYDPTILEGSCYKWANYKKDQTFINLYSQL